MDMINLKFGENEVTDVMNSSSYKNQIKSFSSFNQYPLYSSASTCFEDVSNRL